MDYTVKLTRTTADGDEDCDTDTTAGNDAFCATESYIFVVGPIADLAVEDGRARPAVAANRNALAIVPVNNSPNYAPAARVTGLPTGAEVLDISQGSYDDTTGVWNVGELRVRGYYRSRGVPEPILILSASAGETATVSIASARDYQVCVGPKDNPGDLPHTTKAACEAVTNASWNSTPVYDYNPGNNTATITARRGSSVAMRTSQATAGIGLSWSPQPGAAGYGIEVSEDGGASWRMLEWWVSGTGYTHTGIPLGETRHYRVHAIDEEDGQGQPFAKASAVAGGVRQATSPPGAPEQMTLAATPTSRTEILLNWVKPEDYGSPLTGYTLQEANGRSGPWRNVEPQPGLDDVAHDYGGLQPNTRKYFRIRATNEFGSGLWSNVAEARTVADDVPGQPLDVWAIPFGYNAVSVFWIPPVGGDGRSPVTQYEVQWSADGITGWSRAGSTVDTSLNHTGLTGDVTYYYQVRARNGAGWGPWSQPPVSAVPAGVQPPAPPSLTGVDADGPNAILVAWEAPSFDGGLVITQYEVQGSRDGSEGSWRTLSRPSGSARSWRHTGLKPEETWHYQVRATNGGGRWSPWSYALSAATASDKVPTAAPSGLTATYDADAGNVTLKWNAAPSGSATITDYDLQYSVDNGQWEMLTTTGPDELTYTDGGNHLYPGAQIRYRVRAVADGEGAGPWSSTRSVSVPADPPDAPRIVWTEADGSNHIVIEWEPPYYDGGAAITGYRLLWCRAPEDVDENPCEVALVGANPLADPPGYSRISVGASAQSYTHSVSPDYYYHYLLRATNGGNRWSAWEEYDVYGWIMAYADVPAAPSLTAQAVASDQIKLTWTKPNDYGSDITKYWLYVYANGDDLFDSDNILDIVTVPADDTEWTVGELSPGTTRYFRIRALNGNGEGKYSALRQATTPSK